MKDSFQHGFVVLTFVEVLACLMSSNKITQYGFRFCWVDVDSVLREDENLVNRDSFSGGGV